MSLKWKISVVYISRTCFLAPVAMCCVLFWQTQMIWISLNCVCNWMETLTFQPQEIQERNCSPPSTAFLLSGKGMNSAFSPAIAWCFQLMIKLYREVFAVFPHGNNIFPVFSTTAQPSWAGSPQPAAQLPHIPLFTLVGRRTGLKEQKQENLWVGQSIRTGQRKTEPKKPQEVMQHIPDPCQCPRDVPAPFSSALPAEPGVSPCSGQGSSWLCSLPLSCQPGSGQQLRKRF